MSIRETVYGIKPMKKKALFGGLLPSVTDIGTAIRNIGAVAASYLIAGSVVAGVGTGYLAAKIPSKGKRDEETAKKSYTNERLKADIGYLSGKLREEWKASKQVDGTKSMTIMR